MQKFGLFDLIDKLAPLQKAINAINNNYNTQPKNSAPTPDNHKENHAKKANVSSVILLIKQHDEISKRIDKNLKK